MEQEKYIKLFNYGYFLSKNEPGLLQKLLDTTKQNKEFQEPLIAGEREYKREKLREQMNQQAKNRSQDRGYDR